MTEKTVDGAAWSDWLHQGLDALAAGDVPGWMELYRDDAVHEFPFAPEGGVRRLDGKAAIGEYMKGLPGLVDFDHFYDVEIRETVDPEVAVVESQARGRLVATDAPFHMSYVWIITRRQGRISHIRDYMNALELPAA